jgi:hypothetical protein
MRYESVIGRPYFWQGRGGQWFCKCRGHVFRVPHRDISMETVKALADKAEAAMLERYEREARRKGWTRKP